MKPTKLFVFLHGFGFDKTENSKAISQILKTFPEYELLGINAQYPSGRPRGGYAWFDITKEGKSVLDEKLKNSLIHIKQTIHKKLKDLNLTWKDLVLCGRSQGSFLSILIGLNNPIPCHAIICTGSRFIESNSLNIQSNPPLLWIEMEKEHASLEKRNMYKILQNKGVNLQFMIGKGSDHDTISPETTNMIINELKKL